MDKALPAGKLPGNVLQQEILQRVKVATRSELIVGPGLGLDCAVIQCGDGFCVASMDPITGATTEVGKLAIQVTANDVAAAGVEPVAVLVTILVPPGTTTAAIGEIAAQVAAAASQENIAIAGGHTEITSAVTRPVVVTTGLGFTHELLPGGEAILPGDALGVTKAVAIEGTAILATDYADQLRVRGVSEDILARGRALGEQVSVVREGVLARAHGAIAMHDVTEGGIWGAIDELCAAAGCGFRVEEERVPLRRESAVICQALGVDPFALLSSGMLLIVIRHDVPGFCQKMAEAGVDVAWIGEFTAGKDKTILRAGAEYPLISPERDEIYRIGEIMANEEAISHA